MDIRLDGRVALVTGGSKGLGLATARRFASSGASIAILARDKGALAEAAETIRSEGKGDVESFVCDVSKLSDIEAAYAAVTARFGKIDILVNNAGAHMTGLFEENTEEMWKEDLDLKLFAAIRLCRLAIPAMKARRWGRIINVANIMGKAPKAQSTPTAVSRAAGLALTKALAAEGAPFNVLVNALVVGAIDSDQHRRGYQQYGGGRTYEAFTQAVAEEMRIPMGRLGRSEEFANAACFLASDAASYITGTAINIDGGLCPVL